jgi:hypothetical protein
MPPHKLHSAFLQAGQNVVNLLSKLQKGGIDLQGGSTYTAQQFAADWDSGGKQFLEAYWRDSANTTVHSSTAAELRAVLGDEELGDQEAQDLNRELFQGKHEWIPTNYLGYVVEWSIGKYNDIRWVYLAEVLRIPTRLVVIHPRKLRASGGANDPLGLQGHVGAVYLKSGRSGYSQRTKGQGPFHDELRDLVKASLSATSNDPSRYYRALTEHITAWYWTGDLGSAAVACGMTATALAALPCPYYFNSGQSQYESWGPTMGDMASRLSEGWAIWLKANQNQFAAAQFLPPR